MDIMKITEQMIVFFLLMLAGYGANKAGLMDEKLAGRLTAILIKISIPCMIIASVAEGSPFEEPSELFYTLGIFGLMAVLAPLLTAVFVRVLGIRENRKAYSFLLTMSNCAFLGFPVVQAVFGEEALVFASIFLIPNNLLMFLYGEPLFMGEEEKAENSRADGGKGLLLKLGKKMLHPPILASFAACILCLADVRQPSVIHQTFQYLGGITTPVAMLIIGSSLAGTSWKGILSEKYLLRYSLVKMFVVPVVYYLIFSRLAGEGLIVSIGVMLMAMPSASNAVIFAQAHGGNAGLCSRAVFVTSVMAIFSVPFLCAVLF